MYPRAAKLFLSLLILALVADLIFMLISGHYDQKQNVSTGFITFFLLALPLRPARHYLIDPVGKVIKELQFSDNPSLFNYLKPLLNGIDSDVRVGSYQSNEINAIAISSVLGKESAIAFSSALIATAPYKEFMAIAAHEVAHIKNADSKNKSYILAFHQILNFYPNLIAVFCKEVLKGIAWIVIFSAGLIFLLTAKTYDSAGLLAALKAALPILTPLMILLAAILVTYLLNRATDFLFFHYSRQREFLADAEGAAMTSNADMKQALQLLSNPTASKISFFDTHPPVADRLSRL
jgi:Zn-dependent protease with chaperone function